MKDEILGYCGLYCPGCMFYQNSVSGVKTELDPGVFVTCRGCNSPELTPWCAECGIKDCCRERVIRYCLECDEFPCDRLNTFMNDPKYPYHQDVPENMRRLKEIGLEAWAEEQDKKWLCGQCGSRYPWSATECPGCEGKVNER